MLPLLLVVTADRVVAEPMRHDLAASGFKAYYVESLASALGVVAQWQFDAVLLHAQEFDEALPHLLGRLRDGVGVPVLLVLDRGDEDDQLRSLAAGASQVLVEPTSMRIVGAQLHRLIDVSHPRLRREADEVRFGPLRLDPRRAAATIGDVPLALTGAEFELLLLLASRPGDFVHRETIARTFGRAGSAETGRSADTHICRIRRKLRDVAGHGIVVETVYGRGYRLRLGSRANAREESRSAEWSV